MRAPADPGWAVRIGSIAAAGFVLLALTVRLGLLDAWDRAARSRFRPNDEWGPLQMRVDHIVEGLRPELVLAGFAVLLLVLSGLRRSLRPAILGGAGVALLVVLTVAAKIAVSRPDPHGELSDHGGSFPSGHTATVMVCFGLAVLLLRSRAGWWFWSVSGLAGAVMGWSLLVQAAHWTTDVLGGGLLAVTVLAVMARGAPAAR